MVIKDIHKTETTQRFLLHFAGRDFIAQLILWQCQIDDWGFAKQMKCTFKTMRIGVCIVP